MKTVIGLGQAACDVAECFEKIKDYRVKHIDVGIEGDNCYELERFDSPEQYEENAPNLENFFSDIDGEVLFILSGHTNISGASLRILKQLTKFKPDIMYLLADNEILDTISSLQLNLTFNVLQEYSRSNAIGRIYLISNSKIENLIGDTSILEMESKFNNFLVDTISNIDYFNLQDPVIDKSEQPKLHAKIATYGILNISSGEESLYFPLLEELSRIYYFAINEEDLKKDNKLIKKIKEYITKGIRTSYKIFNVGQQQSYCFFVSYSSEIQKLDNLKNLG